MEPTKPDCWRLALCAVAVSLCATQALAADRTASADAQATYKRDRAACMSGERAGDRAACLQEAGAALQEAKRGGLSNEQAQFDRNRLLRCDSQPAQDRAECVRRMNEGTTSGSVEGGGITRELVTPVAPSKR
jgi:hypothetical protein